MVYVTGDLHGDIDRLKSPAIKKLRRGDTLLVLGDFGFIWTGNDDEQKTLRWLEKRKYKILFIEGTHDNYSLLEKYPIEDFAGGKARKINNNIYHLMRGNIFEIESKKIFCFGGGISDDADIRLETGTWWPEEKASMAEKAHAWQTLEQYEDTVDYICTHVAPGKLAKFLDFDIVEPDEVQTFFEEIAKKVTHTKWFFASYHADKPLGSKASVVYKNVIPLED